MTVGLVAMLLLQVAAVHRRRAGVAGAGRRRKPGAGFGSRRRPAQPADHHLAVGLSHHQPPGRCRWPSLLGLVLVALAVYALVWWQAQQPAEAGLYFNASAADVIGGGVALALLLLGVFILVIRRPNGWGFGLAMLLGLIRRLPGALVRPAGG